MRGTIQKMRTEWAHPIQYFLPLNQQFIPLNRLIGHELKLNVTGQLFCIHCQKNIKKTFNQGYCYRCFIQLAACDLCIVKPHTCHYAQGTCREPEWAKDFCFQPHIVYLANSSQAKVGITRQTQIPTRWIDQGAIQALPILMAQTRQIAGLAEMILAKHISDKTQWQQMLKQLPAKLDLVSIAESLFTKTAIEYTKIYQQFGENGLIPIHDQAITQIEFPIQHYPAKIKAFNLDKTPVISAILLGIKGQYLIFDQGVLNVRKFAGYEIEFNA